MRGSAEREEERRWEERSGRQEAAGLRSRVPRRKCKPLLRAEREGKRDRERKKKGDGEGDEYFTVQLAVCTVALPSVARPEEGSSSPSGARKRGREGGKV